MTGWRWIIGMLLCALLVGCGGLGARGFDRGAMLASLAEEVILPAHATFEAETSSLAESARAFAAAPTVGTLDALQAHWQASAEAWMAVEIWEVGAVRDAFIHTRLYKWPTSPRLIEEHLAGEAPIDEAFIEGVGSTAKGLPAIEYLLFDPTGDEAVLERFTASGGERRLAYVVAASENAHRTAQALHHIWAETGDDYVTNFVQADSDGGELNSSISMLVNEMVVELEGAANLKLATPLGRSTFGKPWPESAEAFRSDQSLPLLIANIEALQRIFQGGAAADAPGLDDLLAARRVPEEGDPLAGRIAAQFERTLAALRAIESPLRVAVEEEPEQVTAAYDEVRALLVLFKADLAAQLGITITFSDNDGD